MQRYIFTGLFLFVTMPLSAYFYTGRSYKIQDSSGGVKFVHLFGDLHRAQLFGTNEAQANELSIGASKLKKSLVITESTLSDECSLGSTFLQWLLPVIDQSCTVLRFIPLACQKNNVVFQNVEFRHHSIKAHALVYKLDPYKQQHEIVSKEWADSLRSYLNEIAVYQKEVELYRDGELLGECYRDILNLSSTAQAKLRQFIEALEKHEELSFATLKIKPKKNKLPSSKNLPDMDLEIGPEYFVWGELFDLIQEAEYRILDARVLHAMYMNKNGGHTFIAVGAAHSENIEKYLGILGYVELMRIGEYNDRKNSNHKALGVKDYLDTFLKKHPEALLDNNPASPNTIGGLYALPISIFGPYIFHRWQYPKGGYKSSRQDDKGNTTMSTVMIGKPFTLNKRPLAHLNCRRLFSVQPMLSSIRKCFSFIKR